MAYGLKASTGDPLNAFTSFLIYRKGGDRE